jgi:hypothetical protein
MDDEQMMDAAPALGGVESGGGADAAVEQAGWDDWIEAQEEVVASGAEPDPRFEPVPYERFQESEYARQQLEPLQGWAPAVQQLAELGITPEQFAARLEEVQYGGSPQWAAPVAPEVQFADWIAEQEIDPDECTRAELLSLQATWRHEQTLGQYQQQAEAAEQQAFQSQWHLDLQSVATQYPEFSNPVLRDALLNTYEGRFGIDPDAYQLGALAEELRGAIQTLTQSRVAHYAQQKQQDALFPVVSGGSAPAPYGAVDFHHLNPTQQQDFLESHFAAATRGA